MRRLFSLLMVPVLAIGLSLTLPTASAQEGKKDEKKEAKKKAKAKKKKEAKEEKK